MAFTIAWILVVSPPRERLRQRSRSPFCRRTLLVDEQLIAGLSARGVYTNLITAGIGIAEGRIEAFAEAGLDHVQLSFQGARPATTDLIGNHRGSHEKKLETARRASAAGLPLTINAPIHRHNIEEVPEFIDMALSLDAEPLEIANAQYAGWALANRNVLMPERAAVDRQAEIVTAAQERLAGVINIDFVPPDYFAIYPKPCMGGWARDAFMVAPDGTVLPCHAAQTIPSLSFERFGERALVEIWTNSPAFNAFRGAEWMQEPCRGCERREIDWGGCRCQAMAIAGDAAATDPACIKSPIHARMAMLIDETRPAAADTAADEALIYRRIGVVAEPA
ncbi:pyrroloquinoline quinone biosynthesis protein PqqE [Mesorhizobium sp. B1-1-7]|nr:pyrroloquinoline quinone biosynthesis protein PqqE [Mesorhizobium sp. B1-1-7]